MARSTVLRGIDNQWMLGFQYLGLGAVNLSASIFYIQLSDRLLVKYLA
jgi:hypothetical protein